MLHKRNRLRLRRDFATVHQQGSRCSTPNLALRALPTVNQPAVRLGISISLKVSKRAVVRNRIKRQLRAAFRQLLPRIETSWDLIIVVRPSAIQCSYWEFLKQLEQLLTQVGVLHGN